MTYKHLKFEDSAVMRSLEKVAVQKGMIKPEEKQIEKTAEALETPSESFSENLLRLCSKLRALGFNKYANEIEIKFLTLKQAQARVYDVTGETGEDLIDAAHPEGSKKLDKNWDDLGSIETITDQHSKILDVVKKLPKGKLANKHAINAVKVVLAQLAGGSTAEEQYNDLAEKNFAQALSIWNKIDSTVKNEGGLFRFTPINNRYLSFVGVSNNIKKTLQKRNPGVQDVNDVTEKINSISDTISPGITGGVNENTWQVIEPMLKRMSDPLSKAMANIVERNKLRVGRELGDPDPNKPAPAQQPAAYTTNMVEERATALTPLFGKIEKLKRQLESFKAVRSVARSPEAMKWIAEELADINDLDKRLDQIPDEQADAMAPTMQQELAEEEAAVQEFFNDWIKPTTPGV